MPNIGVKAKVLDVYDINRSFLGCSKDYFDKREPGEYFLATHVWIVNDKKQFLIQKRSLDKVCEPGKWSISGGMVDSGESSLEGCLRETEEEVNIVLTPDDVQLVMSHNEPDSWGVLVDVWFADIGARKVDIIPQTEELSAVRWASCEEIDAMIAEHKFAANVLFAWDAVRQKI